MKKYIVEIETDDDFEPGCCYECPLHYTEWYDDDGYSECNDYCVLGEDYERCPLIEVNKI